MPMRSALLLTLLAPLSATLAQNVVPDTAARVVASATRTTRLAADRATLYALVEATGDSPADAAQRADRKLQNVTEAVRQLGKQVESSGTTSYGVTSAVNMNSYPPPPQSPYVARHVVRVQIARMDALAAASATVLAAGATSSWPLFESSAADSVRRVRYAEALGQARRDAEAMAAALGGRLGGIIEASSGGQFVGQNAPVFTSFGGRFDFNGPPQSPEVQVSATVTVRYRLLPP